MKELSIAAVILVVLATLFSVYGTDAITSPDTEPQQGGLAQYEGSGEEVQQGTGNDPAVMTTTTISGNSPKPEPAYYLTDEERDLVERVVMGEAGGEPYEGQKAVAQCILNASKIKGKRPAQVVVDLKYTKARPAPTESVQAAVAAVFDDGVTVFDSEVIYFYAPALCRSDWHETQDYVTTIGCHRFFKEAI